MAIAPLWSVSQGDRDKDTPTTTREQWGEGGSSPGAGEAESSHLSSLPITLHSLPASNSETQSHSLIMTPV